VKRYRALLASVVTLGLIVAVFMALRPGCSSAADSKAPEKPAAASASATALPRVIDLGATKCIPCKAMAPVLEGLKKEFDGRLTVDFIDVWENPAEGKKYSIQIIPTQIFYDAIGKEVWRHVGFISRYGILDKWRELGQAFAAKALEPTFSRMEPAKADARPKDSICYLCDGTIDPKNLVVVKTEKGDVRLCGPHCYFILFSCLTEEKTGIEKKVSVTDWASGKSVPLTEAVFLYGAQEKTGRPTIKAFAAREAAEKERVASSGNLLDWKVLQEKELAARCGFCDRAVYPQDAAAVKVDGISTWGCCSHCALGVAARTGKDIEVQERDRLTGEPVTIKTLGGYVASAEPATAVAWFGLRAKPDGTAASAGCFHQGFFTSADSLKKWVEANPLETGKMIPIDQALADKMKLSAEQIKKACKIGECAPK
jgi:thioredoxin 1